VHSASTEAQEDLENIEASIGDLVPVSHEKKEKVSMAKLWDFRPSLMMEGAIKLVEKEAFRQESVRFLVVKQFPVQSLMRLWFSRISFHAAIAS
jgi:hypothetical protein